MTVDTTIPPDLFPLLTSGVQVGLRSLTLVRVGPHCPVHTHVQAIKAIKPLATIKALKPLATWIDPKELGNTRM